MRKTAFLAFIWAVIAGTTLKNDETLFRKTDYIVPTVISPENNLFTNKRYELGKRLFFDPMLSRDSSISCSSCHLPSNAFSDTLQFSLGVQNRIGVRNTPSIMNVAFHPYYNKDGGVNTLEKQVLVPIQEHIEMDFNIVNISDRMLRDSSYYSMSEEAYGRYPDPFVISRALACFERTLISSNSRFDQYVNSGVPLNPLELKGMELFFGKKANCVSCHSGFNFSNYSFENNGLKLIYTDSGRMRVTNLESDRGLFKVPSLRNVELSGPYMHDGSVRSLIEVIEHYSEGIKPFKNKSEQIESLELSINEKEALLSFLLTLTDESLKQNKNEK